MIRAVFAARSEQLLFTCDGHAGGDKGSDIVCAAVSTAVELMLRMLLPDMYEKTDGGVKMEIYRPKGQEREYWWRTESDWATFWEFFTDLSAKYPDRVSVTVM